MGEHGNPGKGGRNNLIRVTFPRDWTPEQIAAAIRRLPEKAAALRTESPAQPKTHAGS